MRRRDFITLLGGTAAAWPLLARAQQGDQIKRFGVLLGVEAQSSLLQVSDKQVLEALAPLGWMEGRNLRVDLRLAGSNDPTIIRPHAEGLVRSAPDIIYASPATAVQVLQQLTSNIPIVFSQNADPGGPVP
jgi:putative tryptophan/tyrosine transport system substrate-binding protein